MGSPRSNCYNPASGEERRPPGLHMRQTSSNLIARAAALSLLVACTAPVVPASGQSFTDKLKGLFGGGDGKPPGQPRGAPGHPDGARQDHSARTAAAAPPPNRDEPQPTSDGPQVTIRAGASTYAVAAPGKQAV